MKRLKRYRDLPYEEKRKVVSLVFEEAERMKKEEGKIDYYELSRITFAKVAICLHPSTIRGWIIGKHVPLGDFKAARRPPDEKAQIIRGLLLTDLSRKDSCHTIWLFLHTTKDFYAYMVGNLMKSYGWTTIKPVLKSNMPEWKMSVYLDRQGWARELERPVYELTNDEKVKLLSGAISGDGCITISVNQKRVRFMVYLSSTEKHKAKTYHQVLESLGVSHSLMNRWIQGRQTKIGNLAVRASARYEYRITVMARMDVKYLLENLRLVQPFKEARRILALRFIEKDVLDRDLVKPVWDYLRTLEKYSTIRSQIRACKLISEEEFDKKNLDKQWILKRLHGNLYKYADMVEELKPAAMKIISDLRPSP